MNNNQGAFCFPEASKAKARNTQLRACRPQLTPYLRTVTTLPMVVEISEGTLCTLPGGTLRLTTTS